MRSVVISATIDDREFAQAMRLYQRATRKSWSDVVNRATGNMAAMASQYAPSGNRADIASLPTKTGRRDGRSGSWWPAYIQLILTHQGFALTRRRTLKGDARNKAWRDPASGRMYGTKGRERYREALRGGVMKRKGGEGSPSRTQARQMSRKIIARRNNTVNAIKGVFARIAYEFGRPVKSWHKSTRGARKFFYTRPATDARTKAEFWFPWTNNRTPLPGSKKATGIRSVEPKARMSMAALNQAKAYVVQDMVRYARERMAKDAARVSASAVRAAGRTFR